VDINTNAHRCRLEGVMNLLRNGLLMRNTGDQRTTELTEESAFQCGFSSEFITPSRAYQAEVQEYGQAGPYF
jgi:hypothetical protein